MWTEHVACGKDKKCLKKGLVEILSSVPGIRRHTWKNSVKEKRQHVDIA